MKRRYSREKLPSLLQVRHGWDTRIDCPGLDQLICYLLCRRVGLDVGSALQADGVL